jgi:hypothetical protein
MRAHGPSKSRKKRRSQAPASTSANGCPMMIVLPTGQVIMGSPETEKVGQKKRVRSRRRHLRSPSRWAGQTSRSQSGICALRGACPEIPDNGWGRGRCSEFKTCPVATKKPNAFGLYNVFTTSGDGSRIAIMTATRARHQTDLHGSSNADSVSSAAVLGSTFRSSSARPA